MEISLNNKNITTKSSNLAELAEEIGLPAKGVAIAVDDSIVPRSEWGDKVLKEGCKVLVIRAACGG